MTNGKARLPSRHATLLEVLSIPTAPFAEHQAVDYIERFCAQRTHVKLARDAVGNVLVHVRRGRRTVSRPVCLAAHLDHPGFVADRMVSRRRVRAFWRGGVPKEYFVGSRVRFHVKGTWIPGRVRSIKTVLRRGQRRVDTAVIDVPNSVPRASIGMWDFPDARIRGTRVYARACDDLAGAAAMLCCIDTLTRSKLDCDAFFLFTRAEEVGFVGAIAAARRKTIPGKCFIVAVEISSELPHARMGDGPILRVGDRSSAFTSAVTAHCQRIANTISKNDRSFKYQRRLMDGGTCESAAYCALGFEATGLCLALGNYHNVNSKRKCLGSEYVDLNDFDNLIKWFVALARAGAPHAFTGRDETMYSLIKDIEREYNGMLRASSTAPL
ncbi:MAG: M20/M25/M40 family metallo-hydrolase [Phycisphaerae bacterium]